MNKEQIYDDQISPLMKQIISICQANGIAMLASFDIAHDGEGPNGEDCSALVCTTHLPDGDASHNPAFAQALGVIQRRGRTATMMIATSHGDGSKTMTAVV